MLRDSYHNIEIRRAISPTALSNDTALVSQIIDMQGSKSLTFAICFDTLSDSNATFTVLIEDGDNSALSDNAAVADADLLGTEAAASFQYDDDNEVRKIGYKGNKRYVRMTITPSGNTGTGNIGAVAILEPLILPAS